MVQIYSYLREVTIPTSNGFKLNLVILNPYRITKKLLLDFSQHTLTITKEPRIHVDFNEMIEDNLVLLSRTDFKEIQKEKSLN